MLYKQVFSSVIKHIYFFLYGRPKSIHIPMLYGKYCTNLILIKLRIILYELIKFKTACILFKFT